MTNTNVPEQENAQENTQCAAHCAHCGEILQTGDEHPVTSRNADGTVVTTAWCETCYCDDSWTCSRCGRNFELGNIPALLLEHHHGGNSEDLCAECARGIADTCPRCGGISPIDEMVPVKTKDNVVEHWCQGCADSYASVCPVCEERVEARINGWAYAADLDQSVCPSCYIDNSGHRCARCGCYYHDSSLFTEDEESGNVYCPDCYETIQDQKYGIHSYSYRPEWKFLRTENDGYFPVYMGMELEAGRAGYRKPVKHAAHEIQRNFKFVACASDGSIPEYGFEMKFHPATINWWRDNMKTVAEICSICQGAGMKGWDTGDPCGIHIHVCREFLTEAQWTTINWLIGVRKKLFVCVAGRKENRYCEYPEEYDSPCDLDVPGSRYVALNFDNDNTIEFRIFRSTLRPETILGYLEFVDAIVHTAENWGEDEYRGACSQETLVGEILTAIKERYPHACDLIKAKALCALSKREEEILLGQEPEEKN